MRRQVEGKLEETGGPTWHMVWLNGDLSDTGYVSATVLRPVRVTDAEIAAPGHTFAAEWTVTSTLITKVWNGFTSDRTLVSGTRCRIEKYLGRWIVTQAEC